MCRAFGEPLSIEELELAAPASGQIQVRVLASAIWMAVDSSQLGYDKRDVRGLAYRCIGFV